MVEIKAEIAPVAVNRSFALAAIHSLHWSTSTITVQAAFSEAEADGATHPLQEKKSLLVSQKGGCRQPV